MTKSHGNKNTLAIAIIGMMFFVFGFTTWVNAILIPYLKVACELSNFESYFVTFAFYISYLVISVPISYLLKKTGFKNGMFLGFCVMACGAFVFVPAALSRSYPLFLSGLFLIGIGLATLQTTANPYVTLLGKKESAARRISIMGICNKTAGIIAPLLLAAVILKPGDNKLFREVLQMNGLQKTSILDAIARRVIWPYATVALVLIGLGILVRYSPLPELESYTGEKSVNNKQVKMNIFQFPHLILGAMAIFLHVGSQIIAIDTIVTYAQGMGLPITEAKVFPSYTLAATICGYLLGIVLIPSFITQRAALCFCSCLGIVLSIMVLTVPGRTVFLGHSTELCIWFLVLLGLANSLIWAGIWPLALDGLGAQVKLGASVLVMGLSGNAILPLIYGYFADSYGLRQAYAVLIPCYLYIAFYAFHGYRVKRWSLI
jgi:glucose/galactose transporter